MADVDLGQAHPIFRWAIEKILEDLKSLGWKPRVASLRRTESEQAQKVKMGYSKTMKSWHVDSTIATLPDGPGGIQEILGDAADIIDRRYGWSGVAADDEFQFWKDLGRVAKKHGCEWGGDWRSFKDVAHVQMLRVEGRTQSSYVA